MPKIRKLGIAIEGLGVFFRKLAPSENTSESPPESSRKLFLERQFFYPSSTRYLVTFGKNGNGERSLTFFIWLRRPTIARHPLGEGEKEAAEAYLGRIIWGKGRTKIQILQNWGM